MSLAQGRAYLAIPGPSVVPDRVLRAMHRAAPNIYEGALIGLTEELLRGLPALARSAGDAAIYIGNGHAAWEAAIANTLRPGDRALVLSTGRFGAGWAEMARRMGVAVELMDFGFRAAADPTRLSERLTADRDQAIRAVLTVQTDTASSVRNDVAALGRAIRSAGHPALFMVDAIASFAAEPMEMDAWGVDVLVTASQKGLMTPPGLGIVLAGPRAQAARERVAPSQYWDWTPRFRPERFYQLFCGTAPTHHLHGLAEAVAMIAEEGIETVWDRHAALAQAVWAAAERWADGGGPEPNIAERAVRSAAVTTFRTAPGQATRIRRWCQDQAGLTLGIGLCPDSEDPDALFRIGHMGHVNALMVLGAIATIDAALKALSLPHGPGATDAAAAAIAAARPG